MNYSFLFRDHLVRTKAEIGKVFDENVGHIFTPHRTSFNESKASLLEGIFFMISDQNYLLTCIKMMMDPLMMRKKLSRLAVTY